MRLLFALWTVLALSSCDTVKAGADADPTQSCDPACGSNASCQGQVCECNDGFAGDGQDCTALASCDVDNGGCDESAFCTGSPGDLSCNCMIGFTGDGTTCVEQSHCLVNNGGCDANADCSGTPGNVNCSCTTGYSGDGVTCADIDECLTDNGGCDATATCDNTPGDRTCTCPAESFGDGLSCRETWTQVGALSDVNLSPIGRAAVVAGSNDRIYFSPTTGDTAEQFLRTFTINSGSFSGPLALPPTNSSDYCACGFTEAFMSDGTNMYMMGNYGYRYSPLTNSWTALPNYTGGNRRGEAGGTYDAISDVFLLIGGRSNETTALRMTFNNPTDSYAAELGTLPIGMDSSVAHTISGTTLSYVAGGDLTGGVGLLSHITGSSTWTRLADAPSSLGRALGMGEFDGLVWVARTNGSLAFYDPIGNVWTAHQINAPAGILGVATVNGQSYVVSQESPTSDVLIHRLNAIE